MADPLRYPSLARTEDRGLLVWAAAAALAFHFGALALRLPQREPPPAPSRVDPIPLAPLPLPPPPPPERTPRTPRELHRLLPVPDPTPAAPEPIREPRPPSVEPLATHDEPLIGPLEAPPARPRRLAGTPGVIDPEIIPESRVQPRYPEAARLARQGAALVLRAVVRADGSVDEVEVLRCDRPGLGFESSAVEAVRRWRYLPATVEGRPVEVYLTILVDFEVR